MFGIRMCSPSLYIRFRVGWRLLWSPDRLVFDGSLSLIWQWGFNPVLFLHSHCLSCKIKINTNQGSPDPVSASTLLSDPVITRTVTKNAINLISSLPSHSHNKCPILHELSNTLPISTTSILFNVNKSTVKRSRSSSFHPSTASLYSSYPRGVRRSKVGKNEKEKTLEWMKENMVIRSGSTTETYRQLFSNKHFFGLYRQYFQDIFKAEDSISKREPRSYNTFIKMKRNLRVQISSHPQSNFLCQDCVRLGCARRRLRFESDLSEEETRLSPLSFSVWNPTNWKLITNINTFV